MTDRIVWNRKGMTREIGTVDSRELFVIDFVRGYCGESDCLFLSGPLVPAVPVDKGGMGGLEFPLPPEIALTGKATAKRIRELIEADRATWTEAYTVVRTFAEQVLHNFATFVLSGEDTSA